MIIKNILIYLCMVALGYVFYLLFVGYLSYYVLLIIILFPLISLILLICYQKHSHLSFIKNEDSFIQGEKMHLQIKKDTLSLGYCRVYLFDSYYLLKKDMNDIYFSYPHCGGIHLFIGEYKQYDILNIFFMKRQSQDCIDITFFPKDIEYDFSHIQGTLPRQNEETYSTTKKGDDPTEIFDIHEYHKGDALKNIHWKLSLKHQKLLIKDNALPIQQAIVIHCLFDDLDEHNDYVFQYLHSFCQYLLQHHYIFILANQVIEHEKQYQQVLSQLLWTKKDIDYQTKSLYQYFIDKEGIHFIER